MRSIRLRRLAPALAAVLVVAACSSGTTGDSGATNSISIATSANFAPFTMVDDTGQTVGYAIDLAQELGQRMGVDVEIHTVEFKSLLQGVSTGRYDMSDGSVTVTPARRDQLDWTDPVATSGSVALVRAADNRVITGLDDSLTGRRIGAIDGSVQQQWATENADDLGYSDLAAYGTAPEAILDLQNGRVDALVYDNLNALYYAKRNPDGDVGPVGPVENPSLIAMGTAKGNEELVEQANTALSALYTEGVIGSLQQKWFGESLPTPTDLDAQPPFPTAPTPAVGG